MNYPLAESFIRKCPLHSLVAVEPVTQELYGTTTYIPDPDAIRTELTLQGYNVLGQDCIEQLCEQVQERLDRTQGREGYGRPTHLG